MKYEVYFKGKKKGLSKEQINAIGYYNYCNIQEDRYFGSIFYTKNSNREKEILENTKKAVIECKKLDVENYC
jgi:hypothetical protein